MTFNITYVTLTSGGTSYKMATNPGSTTGAKSGVYISDQRGIIEPGECNDESRPRGASDGSVLPFNPTYRGKDITLTISIKGSDSARWTRYMELVNLFKNAPTTGRVTLNTNGPGPYTVQLQRLYFPNGYMLKDDIVVIELILSASEAWV